MKLTGLLITSAVAFAGAASAQSLADNPPTQTTVCIDVAGKSLIATCHAQASRLDAREDICLCPAGGERVIIPICPAGVRAPAESAAYEKARREAIHKGSLVGATFRGQPMCVAPRSIRQ